MSTSDSQVRKKMLGVIEQGRDMGGVSWYNTEPLRDKFVAELVLLRHKFIRVRRAVEA